MVPLLLVLLLALVLFGAGFALKALWIVAVIVLAVWLLGFVMRSPEPAAAVAVGTAGSARQSHPLMRGGPGRRRPGPPPRM